MDGHKDALARLCKYDGGQRQGTGVITAVLLPAHFPTEDSDDHPVSH